MNRIKELRLEAKLSQKELADLIEVNQTAVSQWERGITTPRFSQLQKLSNLFHTTETDILGLSQDIAKKTPTLEGMDALTPIQMKIIELMDDMTPEQQDELLRQAEYQLWLRQHNKSDS